MDVLLEIAIEIIGGIVELAIDSKRDNPPRRRRAKNLRHDSYDWKKLNETKREPYDSKPIFIHDQVEQPTPPIIPIKVSPKVVKTPELKGDHSLEAALKEQIPSYFSEKALYLMIILHIFYENDGKIKRDEKKQIKAFLDRQEIALGEDQKKIIKKVSKKRPSIRKINSLIQVQNINSLIVENILNGLENSLRETPSYLKVVEELHKNLQNNDDENN